MTTDGGEPAPCRGFPVFSLQSLRLIADQTGVRDISDDVLLLISEDMTYRVREMICNSIQFTKHSARTKLSIDDVDRALQFASVDHYGSSLKEPEYLHESGIFFVQPEVTDLISETEEIIDQNSRIQCSEPCPPPSLHWLMIDGRILSQNSDDVSAVPKVSSNLVNYSEMILRAIFSDDPSEQSVAFQDLSNNCQIQPVIGHILNAVQSHIKSPDFNLKSLTAILTTFCKLLTNPFITIVIPSLLKITLDTLLDLVVMPLPCFQDSIVMRQRVSFVLSLLCEVCINFSNIFELDPKTCILDRLQEVVASLSAEDLSPISGVLFTCLTCGTGDNVYDYLMVVAKAMHAVKFESDCNQWVNEHHMFAAVAGSLMSRQLREPLHQTTDFKAFIQLYHLFHDHFSDSFTIFLMLENCIKSVAEDAARDTGAGLGWIEEKSGNDLLDSFYQTSEEVAHVCGKKGATNRRTELRAPESNDVSVCNAVTRSDSRKTTPQPAEITAHTIFRNYAALPRNRKVSIMIGNRNPQPAEGESDVAAAGIEAAAGHPVIADAAVDSDEMRHVPPHSACRKKQRVRLQRNWQSRSHHSFSYGNYFL